MCIPTKCILVILLVILYFNKISTYKLVKDINVSIAATFFPENENELETLPVKYPCIIKPAVMYDFYKQVKKKVLVCSDLLELKENYKKLVVFTNSLKVSLEVGI